MWLAIILVCASPYADTCEVMVQSQVLHSTELACFKVGNRQVKLLSQQAIVFYAKPLCQKMELNMERDT
jgi:hypothetical protein|tara:strand:+ start:613 stop:819 length:207 start_codon:yes stop_codon:yes gene_type:complete